MEITKIYIGGWFQRTTLHLTEIWIALNERFTEIELDLEKLRKFIDDLQVKKISRHTEFLDYILVETEIVNYRIYEDGLIVLEKEDISPRIADSLEIIKHYYDERLSPFISYLFSRGAPVPKELADIKTILPYVIIAKGTEGEVKRLFEELGERISSEVSSRDIKVYRGPKIIIVNNIQDKDLAQAIVESQIFFREFKTQLHRYLSIHRIVWERIAVIKERAFVGGGKITDLQNQLREYQKTINLIGTRIKQMDVYLFTRAKIASSLKLDEHLNSLFQYKYETLTNTHKYIQHLWEMTENYLNSAIQVFNTLLDKINKDAFTALRVVTSIGAIAGIFGYLARETLPTFTSQGLIYLGILAVLVWLLNEIINRSQARKNYKIMARAEKEDFKSIQ